MRPCHPTFHRVDCRAVNRLPMSAIEGRRVWDIRELDAAFSALPQVAERNDPKTCSIWKKAH
jgi:hypothetical protein